MIKDIFKPLKSKVPVLYVYLYFCFVLFFTLVVVEIYLWVEKLNSENFTFNMDYISLYGPYSGPDRHVRRTYINLFYAHGVHDVFHTRQSSSWALG